MRIRNWMRHGDVVLVEINKLPEQLKKVEDGIIAHGEVTGHHHKMLDGAVVMEGFDGKRYVDVQKQVAQIVHQEHGDELGDPTYRFKDVPQGSYKIIIKREYRYGQNSKVLD